MSLIESIQLTKLNQAIDASARSRSCLPKATIGWVFCFCFSFDFILLLWFWRSWVSLSWVLLSRRIFRFFSGFFKEFPTLSDSVPSNFHFHFAFLLTPFSVSNTIHSPMFRNFKIDPFYFVFVYRFYCFSFNSRKYSISRNFEIVDVSMNFSAVNTNFRISQFLNFSISVISKLREFENT